METTPTTTEKPDKTKSVLLVDDDAQLLKGLQRHLEKEPYDVFTAICPAEATVVLSRNHVDLIVSDNLMPGNLGTNFLAEVREKFPDIKMIMLSGFLPVAAVTRIVEQVGVHCVLNKPCATSEVVQTIRDALET